ncbi:MAG: type III pantothenate kinase [Sterolibacterium sp.]|nr:type III pantothenate kinase [Sterolibacterium sp.]
MLLCLDCGNTRLKWGIYIPDERRWLAQGALLLTEIGRLPAEIRAQPGYQPLQRIIGCIVAGHEARATIETGAAALGAPLHWNTSQATQAGVSSAYEDPSQLGSDRWAALIGAHYLYPQGSCLVVTAGTATTIDHLDADGQFCGGLILPGIDLMRTALAHHTARLPLAEGDFQPLPRDTRTAIASGCLQATAGAVERMFRPMAAMPGAVCLLSGGAAERFAGLLDIPVRRVENLVLEGLAQIACAEPLA